MIDRTFDITQSAEFQQELAVQRTFMARVYGWMTIGMLITALGALAVASSKELTDMFLLNRGMRLGLGIGAFAVAMIFIFAQNKIAPVVAAALFVVYSAMIGVTTGALIVVIYSPASLVSAFAVTAGMFGTMSVFGYVTKRDLTGVGSFMMMGLIGLIIASFVSFFFGGPNPLLHFVICIAGVIIFTGLAAYDTQKIKQSYAAGEAGSAVYKKAAIYGAFSLYLDFINLFLFIIQLLGNRRN